MSANGSVPGGYSDKEIADARPVTPRVLRRLEEHAGLMRWSDHGDIRPGSLADEFWNRDVPRLLAVARAAVLRETEQ